MTFTNSPTDPKDLLPLMGAEALLELMKAAFAQLEKGGVPVSISARIGMSEIEDCVLEHHARTNPLALRRALNSIAGAEHAAA